MWFFFLLEFSFLRLRLHAIASVFDAVVTFVIDFNVQKKQRYTKCDHVILEGINIKCNRHL